MTDTLSQTNYDRHTGSSIRHQTEGSYLVYFDKMQDISKRSQLCLVISFVLENSSVCENFFGLKDLSDIGIEYNLTASGQFQALTDALGEKKSQVDYYVLSGRRRDQNQ